MTLALGLEAQKLLEKQLKTGQYANADEVVLAALTALDEYDPTELDQETLDAIDESEDQIERGEVVSWRDVEEEIRAQFRGE